MTVAMPAPAALPVPVSGDARGLTVLHDWVAAADDAAALARQLVSSFFVPMAYKPQGPNGVEVAVANATGAILLGQSLGLDPLTSLQQIYVVHGRPGMYSKMKVALAQREGHRIWEEEYSPERSTWAGQRKGSDDVVRITLTIEDAKRAGWTSNAAYAKTPADMLSARASARVVDRIAADALFGLRSIEDLDDEPESAPTVTRVSVDDITAAAPAALVREAVASIALDRDQTHEVREMVAEVGPAATSTDVDRTITDKQWRDINAAFVKLGVTGPGQSEKRLAVLSDITARPIARGSELSEADADLALSMLTAEESKQYVRDVLVGKAIEGQPVEQAAEQSAADQQAEAEQTYAADGTGGGDGYDPTTEAAWGEGQ